MTIAAADAIAVLDELIEALAPGLVVTDPDILESYRQDRARDPEAVLPLAVVRARSTADVQATMRWASLHQVPVVPRGAGTGLSGGASAVAGGIVLSLEHLRDLTIDQATRTVVVGPGVLNVEVKQAVAEYGLWYPPDPSSYEICSIGGNVATNAGGLCCVKYGVTSDYVLGLRVVLADGSAVTLGGPRIKDVAGLPLTKLFVGSEGTLGIVTEVTLRLLPAKPPAATTVAIFDSTAQACAAVVAIVARLRPSMLELMDSACINAVEDFMHMGLDRSAGAMLVAQSDMPGEAGQAEIAFIEAECATAGAREVFSTADAAEGESFTAARRAVLTALEKHGDILLEDIGVPIAALPELIAGVEAIAAANDIVIGTVAHAGDGNAHPLIVYNAADPDATARAYNAFAEVIKLALALDGTITGEHGVGRLKQPYLAEYLGADAMALNQRIKNALDPSGILNPGAVF